MKFIYYIEKIGGVDIFGIISLLVFLVFFVVMMIWVFKNKNKTFIEISRIPLDN